MERVVSLPAVPSSFIGRKREVREVRALLSRTRLATVTGAGGSGKTRLALQVARGLIGRFPDGVVMADLAPLAEARLVQEALASTLGVHEQPGRPLLATIADDLRERTTLILLDNCEHLVAEVAAVVDSLLRSCPALSVLATSRVRLGVAGELAWVIPELGDEDALGLFAERASEAFPQFTITPANRATVLEICRRLDGMPLAIELAAARVRTLSADQIAARLNDRFRLLSVEQHAPVPHQQTLEATTAWSYGLLPREAQRLWEKLAVFAGGFRLDAAEAVCSHVALPDASLVEHLATLVDNSIVQVTEQKGVRRYRMLETIRSYGWMKLAEAGEREATEQRHLAWALALAQRAESEWRGAQQAAWLGRLEEDLDNLRAALEYSATQIEARESGLKLASALWLFWYSRDHIGEGRRWLSRLLEGKTAGPPLGYALNVAGFLAYVQGDTGVAVPLLEESLRTNEALHDEAGASLSLLRLGIGVYYHNDLDRAVEILDQALARYRNTNDRIGIYVAGYELAEALTMRGDFGRARDLHAESLALKQSQGDVFHLGFAHFGLGLLAWRTGDLVEASARLRESIDYRRRIDDWWGITRSIEALAWVESDNRHAGRAAHLMGAAAAMLEQTSTVLSPNYRVYHDRAVAAMNGALGKAAFQLLWERGHALTSDQAVEFALQDKPTPSAQGKVAGTISGREEQIARLVADGLTNRQIARQLNLAERTIDAHLEHIMNKLGYRSRAQIAAWISARK
jgi:predicted ATPase/DNA-binding CsgD family transcriptional regulator